MFNAKDPRGSYFFGIVLIVAIGFSIDKFKILDYTTEISTAIIAIFTAYLFIETSRLRKLQSDQISELRKISIKPKIDIYVFHQQENSDFHVCIVNDGEGAAYDVRFMLSDISNSKNSSHSQITYELISVLFNRLSMIKNGLSSLGPNKERSAYLTKGNLVCRTFDFKSRVDITFKDSEGTEYNSVSFIDFSEYEGIVRVQE